MRKFYIASILMLFVLLTGCTTEPETQKVLYKFDKQTSYSTVELLGHLDDYHEGLVISISLDSIYAADDYKAKIQPGMTAQEIDALIKEMREVSKAYFSNVNSAFIESYNLREFGLVEYSNYSPNITIYLGVNELTIEQIERLLQLSKVDEVLFVEVRRYN